MQSEYPCEHELSILLGADKKGQVFGLDIPHTRRNQNAAPTIFELRLPQSVTKISTGFHRAPWYQVEQPVAGILADDVVGSTTDGTVYHFTILSNEARLLLKFLENLVQWDKGQDFIVQRQLHAVSRWHHPDEPRMDATEDVLWPQNDVIIDPEYIPGEAGQRNRRDMHGINGDLLMPLIAGNEERGARLRAMLSRDEMPTKEQSSRYVGNELGLRWEKLVSLTRRVVPTAGEAYDAGGDHDVIIEACLDWLGHVLRPAM